MKAPKEPLDQKTRAEMIQEGLLFYGGTVSFNSNEIGTQGAITGVLGYITSSGKTYVYSGMGTERN